MATTISLKNSVTTSNTPSSLAQGEVAINVTDKKVWVGNAATTPVLLVNGGSDGVFTSVTDSGLTNTRLTYAGTGGLLKDSANIVTDGSKITTSTGFVGGPWTTSTRPASPATGQQGFNSTLGVIEVYDGTAWVAAATVVPTITIYTSGSGTYTTPTGCKYLFVQMVGGGGGGCGGGDSNTAGGGGTGGTTTFGSAFLSCPGGSGGGQPPGGAGGSLPTGGDINVNGNFGISGVGAPNNVFTPAGTGGASFFGGASNGGYVDAGGAGVRGSGGGGGGLIAGGTPTNQYLGGGGGSGGYLQKTISSPAASYSYAVGAGGAAGTAGTYGKAGGAGGAGVIIITAYF